MEDLTPQPSTRPWWSMLNFNNCCRPEDDKEDDDKNYTYSTKQSATTLKVITSGIITDDGKVNIETPMTACSDGSSDSSFESSVDTFIGEITISTPKSKSDTFAEDDNNNNDTPTAPGFYATLSPEKLATLVEDVDDAGEMSDPDEGDYWYSNLNESPMKKKSSKIVNDTDDDVPEINVDGDDMPEIGSQSNTINMKSTQQQQLEIGFPHFLILMMFRHLFGSWLPQLNPTTFFFNNSKLITQFDSSNKSEEEKKEFCKMMRLRKLEYSDSSLEVVPQLKEANGSCSDSLIPVIE